MSIHSPIRWLGGKSPLLNWITKKFPPHSTYVEPFGGGGSVLFAKRRCSQEVYNDRDERLANLFLTLQDKEALQQLVERLLLTPYSRAVRKEARQGEQDALDFFVCSQQSFGGMVDKTAWGFVTSQSSGGMASTVSHYVRVIENLPAFHRRLQGVEVLSGDWEETLHYDSPDTLFYLDPPYVPDTRRDGSYDAEMSLEDHEHLIERVQELEGAVLLSGYENEVYRQLEDNGWRRFQKKISCMVVARTRATGLQGSGGVKATQERVESLWMNPQARRRRP